MNTLVKIGVAPILGVLLYFSQDGLVLLPLAFVAFTGLFYLLDSTLRPGMRLLCIALFTAAYALANFSYLTHAAADGSLLALVLAVIPWFVYMVPMLAAIFCKRRMVEAFVFAWLIGEIIFLVIPIGNPYLMAGTPLSYLPDAIQWYRYTGPIGGSIWLLGLSYLLYRTLIRKNLPYYTLGVGTVLPILCSLLIGGSVAANNGHKERTVGIVALQAGNTAIDSLLRRHNTISCDYILSPEAISSFAQSSMFVHPTLTAIRRSLQDSLKNSTVFIGAYLVMPDHTVTNSMVAYSRDDAPQFRYKSRYIPFGEYLPWRSVLGGIKWINEAIPYDLTAVPNTSEIIRIGEDNIAPLICYEGIFLQDMCEYCRQGAEIFFVAASNEMVNNMHCERQMVNINRANAIATNRYVVRATQAGLSYVVDNRGRIKTLNSDSDALIVQKVGLIAPTTFYCRYHEGLILTYLWLGIGGLVGCWVRSRSKSH